MPTGHSSRLQRKTQAQSEQIENNIPSKWYPEKSGCSSIYIRQNRFQDLKRDSNKDGYLIRIKRIIQQENITLNNLCTEPTNRPKGRNYKTTVIEGDLNPLLTTMDRSCRQKVNKEISALNDTLDRMD